MLCLSFNDFPFPFGSMNQVFILAQDGKRKAKTSGGGGADQEEADSQAMGPPSEAPKRRRYTGKSSA